ncbi:hypothetical protein B0H14DRAFT_3166566 [Mycena olivaceomarginata]|nr:hypothetical protein B0H14DRAFT_3166566 [Mycena olivaceomarginata]
MHAAFVASPRVLTIFSAVPPLPWRALRTRRAPPAARAEPAAVVPHRARHTRRPPIRCDRLQRRPTVCSKPGPVAQREYDAHHHQRTQYTLQRLPIICATLVPSPRAPTICSVDLPSPLDSPACASLGTVPSTTYVRRIRREYSPSPTLRPCPLSSSRRRRIAIDCALDAADPDADVPGGLSAARKPLDPAMRAARMSLADVVQQLRKEEGVWFDGMDWGAKRRNARVQEGEHEEREQERERGHHAGGSHDSSAGTPRTSDASLVLSTSTLGTTPSLPPPGERKALGVDVEEREQADDLCVTGVSPSTTFPYVPETIAHLPHYSLDAIRLVWREACAPLHHCRCSVYARAMAAQQMSTKTAIIVPAPASSVKGKQPEHEKDSDGPLVMHIPSEDATAPGADSGVKLVQDDSGVYDHDGPSSDGGGKGLEGLTAQELYWLQVEEEEGPGAWDAMELVDEMANGKWKDSADSDDEEVDGEAFALPPAPVALGARRERLVRALGGRARGDDADAHSDHSRAGTPPKRARTGERVSSPRLAKRRSDSAELDVDDRDAETGSVGSAPKRARIEEDVGSPPDSTSTPGTTTASDTD